MSDNPKKRRPDTYVEFRRRMLTAKGVALKAQLEVLASKLPNEPSAMVRLLSDAVSTAIGFLDATK